ncbi:MAG: hypothetical protein ACYSU7_19095 [Planctomycetota bacterium]|jgi:hypothetical protein
MAAVIRLVLAAGLCGGAAVMVYWKMSATDLRRALDEMAALQQEMDQRLEAKEAMIQRLNRSRRLAHIHVEEQRADAEGNVQETDLLFVELDDAGGEIARQQFTLPGEVVFVDAWAVKFHHNDVAEGNALRGQTLLLLRRIYSDRMAPIDGYPIDVPGAIPPGYAVGEIASFEKRLWEHFWEIATDPDLAAGMGVRVAQGEAVYKPVRVGRAYELTVDATGGMSLLPLPVNDLAVQKGTDLFSRRK